MIRLTLAVALLRLVLRSLKQPTTPDKMTDQLNETLRKLYNELPHPALLEAADRLEKYESAGRKKQKRPRIIFKIMHCLLSGHDWLYDTRQRDDQRNCIRCNRWERYDQKKWLKLIPPQKPENERNYQSNAIGHN